MDEKELRKQLAIKQAEMEKAQREYDKVHYSKQIKTFANTLCDSNELLALIQSESLNADDCRLLAGMMAKRMGDIYHAFAEIIRKNQERRKSKNQLRASRRLQPREANTAPDTVAHAQPSYVQDGQCHGDMATVVRQY